jgi:hypothetical protein
MAHKVYTASGGNRGVSAQPVCLTNFSTQESSRAVRRGAFCNKWPRQKLRRKIVMRLFNAPRRSRSLLYRSIRNPLRNNQLELMRILNLQFSSSAQGLPTVAVAVIPHADKLAH